MTEFLVILAVVLALLLGVALCLLFIALTGKSGAREKRVTAPAIPPQATEFIKLLRYDGTEQE